MIESKYNLFLAETENEVDGSMIAFNCMTCALAKLAQSDYKAFIGGRENGFVDLNDDFLTKLKHGRFLIEDNYSELDNLKYRLLQSRYATNFFTLTIAPTMGCNFDCIYCYESDHSDHSKMSIATQDALVRLIEDQITTNGIRSLNVVWYGGEPLLAMDVITSLSSRILPLCAANNVNYHAKMISNGYLLSKEVIEEINTCNISSIQITIDGPRDIHDARRFIAGGIPTYEIIVKNLLENIEIIPRIALRINADLSNRDRVMEVKALFDEPRYAKKISTYIAIVDAPDDEYSGCLTMPEFSELESKFYTSALRLYPHPHSAACGADTVQSMVIGPDGAIYKCWNDIGTAEMSVGNIGEDNSTISKRYFDYLLYEATDDADCSQCLVLPICMGGCPHRRLTKSPLRCPQRKYDLESYIRTAAKEVDVIKRKRESEQPTK